MLSSVLMKKDGLVSSGDEIQRYDQHCWTCGIMKLDKWHGYLLRPVQVEEQLLPHPANGAKHVRFI